MVEKPKRPWSLRRKLLIALAALLVVIGLAVGLGVGLTRNNGGNDDGGSDDDNGGNDIPSSGPNRTETWTPKAETSWQIVLSHAIDVNNENDLSPDVEVYDIDAEDNDHETISTLRKMGKKVICYFSAGSYENWRRDKDDFDESDLGKPLDGWAGERWVNVSSPGIRNIMKKRIHDAWAIGCDAIDPDNVDGYVSSLLLHTRDEPSEANNHA